MRIQPRPAMRIRISPRAPVLPANVLRFYLHCPRPWEAYFDRDRLRLRDEAGQSVPDPFLVLSQELWSADGRRLTVLMEPGRLKRGMGADPAHEPALVVGRRYSLAVTALGQTMRHTFHLGEALMSPLDEARWRVTPPTAGGLDPVVVAFDRVVDAALCEDEIVVLDQSRDVLPTRARLDADGTVARFVPDRPWHAGAHRLLFSSRFEDVCGNRLGEALDHALGTSGRPRGGAIVFSPRSPDTVAPAPPRPHSTRGVLERASARQRPATC